MYCKRLMLLFMAIFVLATSSLAVDQPSAQSMNSKPWQLNVTLASQIFLPTPRPIPDIFFELNNTTPNMVYRVERDQANDPINLAKEAYATTNATPHDTYKLTPNPLGPFARGVALGFTLGQWIAAYGNGTYAEENGSATVNLTFHKLVPNGTYTVWYVRLTMPPNYEYFFTPVGASDGSQNIFKADSKGNGIFDLKLKALPPSTDVTWENYTAMYVTHKAPISTNITWTLISVAYHSDGRTYGAMPGELGKTTHFQLVHLMYPKPAHTFQEWKNATTLAATSKAENSAAKATEKQPGFEGISAIAALLFIARYLLGERL
jgi:hypothetical protein